MENGDSLNCRIPSQPKSATWSYRVTCALARFAQRCAFRLLRAGSAIVLPFLLWLAAGDVVLWFVFVGIAHDSDFPTSKVMMMALSCLLGALGYCALLETLRPNTR